MFSLCFIELQQMSNKLEKLFFFKLPNILFVQCTQIGAGRGLQGCRKKPLSRGGDPLGSPAARPARLGPGTLPWSPSLGLTCMGASVGFLTRYDRELREPLVWCQGSQVSIRVVRGRTSLLSSHGSGIRAQHNEKGRSRSFSGCGRAPEVPRHAGFPRGEHRGSRHRFL